MDTWKKFKFFKAKSRSSKLLMHHFLSSLWGICFKVQITYWKLHRRVKYVWFSIKSLMQWRCNTVNKISDLLQENKCAPFGYARIYQQSYEEQQETVAEAKDFNKFFLFPTRPVKLLLFYVQSSQVYIVNIVKQRPYNNLRDPIIIY